MTFPDAVLRPRWRRAVVTALACAAAVVQPAAASTINCGDTLGAGTWLLETDLVCPSNSGSGVGLTLASGATLDLGGHSVGMSIAGSGTSIQITGTAATLENGTVKDAAMAILLSGGGSHDLHDLRVTHSNIGLFLDHSDGNDVSRSDLSGNAVYAVSSDTSHRNRYDELVANETSGIGPAAGILLFASDDNVITRSDILRNQCTGIFLVDSSRNAVTFNVVQDTRVFLGGPSVDILLVGASTENLILRNQVSATATPPVTSDGINVGCKEGCVCGIGPNSTPSAGATHNRVIGNTANGELRFGIAQAPGNPDNVYAANKASGNGVADFAIDP